MHRMNTTDFTKQNFIDEKNKSQTFYCHFEMKQLYFEFKKYVHA